MDIWSNFNEIGLSLRKKTITLPLNGLLLFLVGFFGEFRRHLNSFFCWNSPWKNGFPSIFLLCVGSFWDLSTSESEDRFDLSSTFFSVRFVFDFFLGSICLRLFYLESFSSVFFAPNSFFRLFFTSECYFFDFFGLDRSFWLFFLQIITSPTLNLKLKTKKLNFCLSSPSRSHNLLALA